MNTLTPEDPRLTACALGELPEGECAVVEAAVAADPLLKAAVDDIRATVSQLEVALAAEPSPVASAAKVSPFQRAAIIAGRDNSLLDGGPAGRRGGGFFGNLIRFPSAYYLVGGLAAAVVAVLIVTNGPSNRASVAKAKADKKAFELRFSDAKAEAGEKELKAREPSAIIIAGPVDSRETVVPPSAPEAKQAEQSQVVTLSPFELNSSADPSFKTEPVGTGGRMDLKETPQSYSVINRGMIDSLGMTDLAEAAAWMPGQTFSGGQSQNQAAAPAAGASGGRGGGGGRGGPPVVAGNDGAVRNEMRALGQSVSESFAIESYDFGRGPNAARFGDGASPTDYGITNETYQSRVDNRFVAVGREPLSTFSIDVDSAGYSNLRRFLAGNQLPPREAVRVEEMINYFPYRYVPPTGNTPFAASLEVASAPWDPTHRLVRIGVKGREVSTASRPRANLVFLIDVSGSMNMPNKLPLVKQSLGKLLGRLREDDHVAIVVYAGASGLALPSTEVSRSREIKSAIDALTPGGSTNGAMGIQLAYDIAKANFVTGGVNRVILCTDGDFNVGMTNENDLMGLVQEKAKSNVFLTVLGFGMGNLKDRTLEMLADKGNGNYGYIDNGREADKLLVDQVSGTLVTIAKDVKIQVEFNPAQVRAYRLIGYENRLLAKEDFNNDKVDAGEIGAGHTVTALYEIIPANGALESEKVKLVDDLKYQNADAAPAAAGRTAASTQTGSRSLLSSEMLTLKMRYKEPTGDVSSKLEFPLIDRGSTFSAASADFRFAASVAAFGLALRSDSPRASTLADVSRWAESALGDDTAGYRGEFLGLIRKAQALLR